MKTCTKCGLEKGLEEFALHRAGKDGRRSACKACVATYNKSEKGRQSLRKYRRSEKGRKVRSSDKYTERQIFWSSRYRAAEGHFPIHGPLPPRPEGCECCGHTPSEGGRSLSADHDHIVQFFNFRAWLCDKCNLAFGKLGDTAEDLDRAARRLARFEIRQKIRAARLLRGQDGLGPVCSPEEPA